MKKNMRFNTYIANYNDNKMSLIINNGFKIDNYPEGWLINKICEINHITVIYLGKLMEYDDLTYHLKSRHGFKGGRIESLKKFKKVQFPFYLYYLS